MTLHDWEQRNKWLVVHPPSKKEIAEIVLVGDRDLSDSRLEGLSTDSRLMHAYGAALQFAAAALAAAGYRPARGENHHYRTLQSLALTIGWDANRIDILDRFRKKRNVSAYERAGTVSEVDAASMQALAETLRSDLMAWMAATHQDLI